MSTDLSTLKPSAVWRHFQDICAIPHPSKHEAAISKFLAEFGRKLGLETVVDHVGNVVIRKPATPGMEGRVGVILQGHMDMVPQKNREVRHDFTKDPIQVRIVGERVTATGTTLGADNGIGVAAAMAVLEAKDLSHGPIEALITVDEEAGMTGANELKPGVLRGQILINMDSEDEDELCIGCAGGIDTVAAIPAPEEPVAAGALAFKVEVLDLKGGHSGVDIALGRGNSNKVMVRILYEALRETDLRLVKLDGGDLRNAIPRDCAAVVAVSAQDEAALRRRIAAVAQEIADEIRAVDPDWKVVVTPQGAASGAMSRATTQAVLSSIYACPHGAFAMIRDMPTVVETSNNLAIVKTEGGAVRITCMTRSSVDTRKVDIANMIRSAFELAGAEVKHSGSYPGWTPNVHSPILKAMQGTYREMRGRDIRVAATHGGLECGIIGAKYPGLDSVSCGATLKFPHSPDEFVEIPTVQRFWDFLVRTLERVPSK
ncbi:MAG: cytosol nonspecific dipeptidase [Elusimicrobia bacterium GWA2_69_24]|nr:MAG: cytosol nonspecific dipeptidase [Elusimicrobia bacterium GWA2_69_24]HBL18351.1 cytosol nonspecific dipeptidase [Elusimicrobiota bacterium]